MGGINQIINIYSNINRMTDQQKGYGLGIILGIRLPCLRVARAGRGPCERSRGSSLLGAARRARARLSLYPHITSTYIRRYKFDQNVNTVCVENNKGSYFFMLYSPRGNRTRSSVIFCASIDGNRPEKNDYLAKSIWNKSPRSILEFR